MLKQELSSTEKYPTASICPSFRGILFAEISDKRSALHTFFHVSYYSLSLYLCPLPLGADVRSNSDFMVSCVRAWGEA